MSPAAQRRALGMWTALMGVVHFLPVAFIALSAAGPAPLAVSPRTMSAFYYGHFITLTAVGLVGLAARAAKDQVFHGGPFIDFAVALTLFMLAASVSPWLAGPVLVALGLRLMSGSPFFNPPEKASS
jgi:hypothetical protein